MKVSLSRNRYLNGFTLLEILVSVVIFLLLLMVVLSALGQGSRIWLRSMDKIKSFQEARLAFESVTRNVAQATLNTYLDYDNPGSPQHYLRKSDLRFLIGDSGSNGFPGTAGSGQAIFFQAPIGYATNAAYSGITGLLNACGYFVSFSTNSAVPPHIGGTNNPFRYRLLQMLVPSEQNAMSAAVTTSSWFSAHTNLARPVADNVIALILRPVDESGALNQAPNNAYRYDTASNATQYPQPITANQLPPVVEVTLIAIDESSAKRIANGSAPPNVIANALREKFADPANHKSDLEAVKTALNDARLNYRIFSSVVPIRESKWMK